MAPRRFKHKPVTFNSGNAKSARFTDKSAKKNDEEDEPNTISHLQPEILPLHLMKSLLLLRGGGEDVEQEESLEKIVQLFYKHITPKPQRHYKENRKGKFLMKLRHKKEKFKTCSADEYNIIESTGPTLNSRLPKSTTTTTTTTPAESRLKEPISCIDVGKKKIRLNSSSSSSSLDSIQIIKKDRVTVKSNSPETKTKIQITEEDKRPLKRSSGSDDLSGSKKIKLSRNISSTLSADKSSQDSATSEKKEKKKKFISWP